MHPLVYILSTEYVSAIWGPSPRAPTNDLGVRPRRTTYTFFKLDLPWDVAVDPRVGIYPSYHRNLNLACGESREAGKRLRTDYLHPEHDTIYLDVVAKPEDFGKALQILETTPARRLALEGPREWWTHDTGELISRFPCIIEMFVIRRSITEVGGNLQAAGGGLLGFRVTLEEQWPLRGLWWDGLTEWQLSMVRTFGGGLDIREANATETWVCGKRTRPR